MDERYAYLGFSLFPGIGPVTIKKLIKYYGNLSSAFISTDTDLQKAGLSKNISSSFIVFRKSFLPTQYCELLQKENVWFVTQSDLEYPTSLLELTDSPLVIFGKGNIDLLSLSPKVGIVGTRKMSSYGRNVTEMFAKKLGESGCVIVSGLALGVDVTAHNSSCLTRGRTIAVLGNGVDECFPKENNYVYQKILNNDGTIISEYPLYTKPSKGTFPSRNRIIAALSDVLLVTEGQKQSGSLITADISLSMQKKVFAVPGSITSVLSQGPLYLLSKGAHIATSPDDVLSILGRSSLNQKVNQLDPFEEKIFQLLLEEPRTMDQLVRLSKQSLGELALILSQMEIKNIIKRTSTGFFIPS